MKKRLRGQDTKTRINEVFVNRLKEKLVFQQFLSKEKQEVLPVLFFYGIGGVGKSALSRHLIERAHEQKIRTALLDFDLDKGGNQFIQDYSFALAEIRRQLDVDCPRFDLAYAMLRYKQGLGDEPLLKGSGKANTAWEVTKEGAAALVNDIPGSNLLIWMTEKLGSQYVDKLKESKVGVWVASKTGNDDFLRLMKMLPQQIYPELIHRLGVDWEEEINDHPGRCCQALVFIDSFEVLANQSGVKLQQQNLEAWVRELYENITNVGLIISGRDALQWHQIDPDWAEETYLRQINLNGLADVDSREFLALNGIVDEEDQNPLLIAAELEANGLEKRYHPLSLGICVDTVRNQAEHGANNNLFTGIRAANQIELAQRFLSSIPNDALRRWLFYLALSPEFTEEAAKSVYSSNDGVERDLAWQKLVGYSFVRRSEQGHYSIHNIMQQALSSLWEIDKTKAAIHEIWAGYWSGQSEGYGDHASRIAFYHQFRIDPYTTFLRWQEETIHARVTDDMALHANLAEWVKETGLENQTTYTLQELKMLCSATGELALVGVRNRKSQLDWVIANAQQVLAFGNDSILIQAEAHSQLASAYVSMPGGHQKDQFEKGLWHSDESIKDFQGDFSKQKEEPLYWLHLMTLNAGIKSSEQFGKQYLNEAVALLDRAISFYEAYDKPDNTDKEGSFFLKTFNPNTVYINLLIGRAFSYMHKGESGASLEDYQVAIQQLEKAKQHLDKGTTTRQKARLFNTLAAAYADASKLYADEKDQIKSAWGAVYHGDKTLELVDFENYPLEWCHSKVNAGYGYSRLRDEEASALDEAKARFVEVMDQLDSRSYPKEYGLAFNNLITCVKGHELEELVESIQQESFYQDASLSPFLWAQTMHNLGNAYLRAEVENPEKARYHLHRAVEVYTLESKPVSYAACMHAVGLSYHTSGQDDLHALRESLAHFEKALTVYVYNGLKDDEGETLYWIAKTYRKMGDLVKDKEYFILAVQNADRAISIYSDLQKQEEVKKGLRIKFLGLLALSKLDASYAHAANELLVSEIDKVDRVEDPDWWAALQWSAAEIKMEGFKQVQDHRILIDAIQNLEQALTFYTVEDYAGKVVEIQNQLIQVYATIPFRSIEGHFEKIHEAYQKIVGLIGIDEEPGQVGMAVNNFCGFYLKLAEVGRGTDQSKSFLETSETMLLSVEPCLPRLDPEIGLMILQKLSSVYRSLTHWDPECIHKSLTYSRLALDHCHKFDLKANEVTIVITLATSYISMTQSTGDEKYVDLGIEDLKQLLGRWDDSQSPQKKALVIRNIGAGYMIKSKNEDETLLRQAILQFNASLPLYAEAKDLSSQAQVYHTLMACYAYLKEEEQAVEMLKNAVDYYRQAGFEDQAQRLEAHLSNE